MNSIRLTKDFQLKIKGLKGWTLFLDRDGVINKRIIGEYVRKIDEFELLPGVAEAIKIFNGIFKYVIIVSNQQGIGKGIMSEDDLLTVHSHMLEEFAKVGGLVDRIYFSPELAIYKPSYRKPEIGMALHAKEDFPDIDFSRSLMIGDSISDMEFARKAGMYALYLSDTSDEPDEKYYDGQIDSLISFARLL